MRNIFFRGFDEVSRQWIHGSLLKFLITGDKIEYAIRDINHKSITVNAESVGQLIERDDINDVPAYEGDIVKVQVEQLITTIEAVGYIEIINTAGGAHVTFDDHSISVPLSAFEEFEIVGNGAECLKPDKDVEIKPDEKGMFLKTDHTEFLTVVDAGNAVDLTERFVDLLKTVGGDKDKPYRLDEKCELAKHLFKDLTPEQRSEDIDPVTAINKSIVDLLLKNDFAIDKKLNGYVLYFHGLSGIELVDGILKTLNDVCLYALDYKSCRHLDYALLPLMYKLSKERNSESETMNAEEVKSDGGVSYDLDSHEKRLFILINKLGFKPIKKQNATYDLLIPEHLFNDSMHDQVTTDLKSLLILAMVALSKIGSEKDTREILKFIKEYSLFLDEQRQIKKGVES